MPAPMPSFVEEASAEFNVLSMRPERRTGKHAFREALTIMRGEHLGHAGPIGSPKVEGSCTVIQQGMSVR